MLLMMIALAGVFAVKYYTSVQMRSLDRRLQTVKADLDRVKGRRKEAEEKLNRAQEEENAHQERIRYMNELTEDLRYRLTVTEEEDDELIVRSSATP